MLLAKQTKQIQPKKPNFETIRYSIDSKAQDALKLKKSVGRKIQKEKIQIRLTKHLSQLPIDPYLQSKANQTNIYIHHRPHSSLVNYQNNEKYEKWFNRDTPEKQYQKVNSTNANNFNKKKKKHLSVQSIGSVISRNSLIKRDVKVKRKSRRNSRSFEQQHNSSTFKNKLAANRKKYNHSCNQFIDDKENRDNHNRQYSRQFRDLKELKDFKNVKVPPKKSVKNHSKKHSINSSNLVIVQHKNSRKENNEKSKTKLAKIDAQQKQKNQTGLVVSKNKASLKQKSSLNVSINPHKKSEKIKQKAKKSKKFIISKDESSEQQYPVQKYILQSSNIKKQKSNSKSRSRGQRSSLSKSKKKNSKSKAKGNKQAFINKKLSFEYSSIQNPPYMNALSASSNVIRSNELSVRSARQRNQQRHIKIVNRGQHIHNFQQEASSLDIDQIRFFEKQSPENQRNDVSVQFKPRKLNDAKRNNNSPNVMANRLLKMRVSIIQQINEKYPVLSDAQKIFLASVILIQRQWKKYQFYDKIFKKKSPLKKTEQVSTFLNMKDTKVQSIMIEDQNKSYSPLFKKGQEFDNANMIKKTEENLKYSEIIEDNNKRTIQQVSIRKSQIRRQVEQCEIGIQVEDEIKGQLHVNYRQIHANSQNKMQRDISQRGLQQPLNSFPYRENAMKLRQTQVFPSFAYLQVRKAMLRDSTQKNLESLFSQYSSRKISQQKYSQEKNKLQKQYEASLLQLKKSKRNIKKGYLKFIQCLQSTHSFEKQLGGGKQEKYSTSGLRKVSSQSGFMSIIYSKLHEFNKAVTQNSSSDSESLKRLSSRILIRKQYIEGKQIQSARKFENRSHASNISNLNNSELLLSQRGGIPRDESFDYESDQTIVVRKNKQIIILSSRQNSSDNTFGPIQESVSKQMQEQSDNRKFSDDPQNYQQIQRQQKVSISDFLIQTKNKTRTIQVKSPLRYKQKVQQKINQQQFKWSQKLKKYTQQCINQYQRDKQCESLQIADNQCDTIVFNSSDQLQISKEYCNSQRQDRGFNKIQSDILDLVLWELTKQLHQELIQFNTFEQEQLQDVGQSKHQRVVFDKGYSQHCIQPLNQQAIVRPRSRGLSLQYQIQGGQEIIDSLKSQQKQNQYKLNKFSQEKFQVPSISSHQANGHKVSPLSSHRQSNSSHEVQQILIYLREFIQYIRKDQTLLQEALQTINQDQGFSPFAYLKFLRNFQIPQDQYKPVISNEAFVAWETYYFSNHQAEFDSILNNHFGVQNIQKILKQSQTIFHRCLFEGFVSQLQKERKYGQKGKPFPWQNNVLHTPQIDNQKIQIIFTKSLQNIQKICSYKCGIIDSKCIFVNQEELQRVHQQNEDRIINMLEDQLGHSPNNWYQLQEHMLELRLEICMTLEQQIFDELVKQLAQISFTRLNWEQ